MRINEENFVITGEIEGENCKVEEVYHSAIENDLSFVTPGWTKPELQATITKAKEIDPYVTRVRIMTSDTFDLMTLYIFELVDDIWRERSLVAPQTR